MRARRHCRARHASPQVSAQGVLSLYFSLLTVFRRCAFYKHILERETKREAFFVSFPSHSAPCVPSFFPSFLVPSSFLLLPSPRSVLPSFVSTLLGRNEGALKEQYKLISCDQSTSMHLKGTMTLCTSSVHTAGQAAPVEPDPELGHRRVLVGEKEEERKCSPQFSLSYFFASGQPEPIKKWVPGAEEKNQ